MNPAPSHWDIETLADVAIWGSGGTPKAGRADYYDGPVPWAVIGDLNNGLVGSTAKAITHKALDESSAKVVPPGAVLVAMYGSIGKLGIPTVPMATNQAIAFAIPHQNRMLQRFLFWYLRSQRALLAMAGKGATQSNISQTILKAWPVPVPPLEEQQRIVEAIEEQFSRLDAGVESLQRARRNLTRFRSAVLEAAMVDASRFGGLARTDEIAHIQLGRQRSPRHHRGPHMRPYLRAANVTWSGVMLDDVKQMDFPPEDFDRFRLASGDILLNEASGSSNEVGKPAIWDGSIPDACFQNTLLRVRPTDSIDRRFLHLVFYAAATNGGFAKVARGVNIMHLGKAGLAAWRVHVPPLEEQHRIVAEVDRQFSIIDAMAKTIDDGLQRAGTLRQSILSRAFSGKLTGAA